MIGFPGDAVRCIRHHVDPMVAPRHRAQCKGVVADFRPLIRGDRLLVNVAITRLFSTASGGQWTWVGAERRMPFVVNGQ